MRVLAIYFFLYVKFKFPVGSVIRNKQPRFLLVATYSSSVSRMRPFITHLLTDNRLSGSCDVLGSSKSTGQV
jgi:hypothetical protein